MRERQSNKREPDRKRNRDDRQSTKAFELALLSPLLDDDGWLREFERLVRRVLTIAQDLSRNRLLPGYPLWVEITDLRNALGRLTAHLARVGQDFRDRMEKGDYSPYGVQEKIAKAYQWASSLVAKPEPNSPPWVSLNEATPQEILSWLPTSAELEAWKAILDLVSHRGYKVSRIDGVSEQQEQVSPPTPGPEVSITGNEATIDGKVYVLDEPQAAFFQALANAGPGVWVVGPEMGQMVQPRPDRVYKKLPESIKAKIESSTKGYRIRKA